MKSRLLAVTVTLLKGKRLTQLLIRMEPHVPLKFSQSDMTRTKALCHLRAHLSEHYEKKVSLHRHCNLVAKVRPNMPFLGFGAFPHPDLYQRLAWSRASRVEDFTESWLSKTDDVSLRCDAVYLLFFLKNSSIQSWGIRIHWNSPRSSCTVLVWGGSIFSFSVSNRMQSAALLMFIVLVHWVTWGSAL